MEALRKYYQRNHENAIKETELKKHQIVKIKI